MLGLLIANVVGGLLFATVYAAAGARWLTQDAFLVSVALVFVLVTGLWVSTERRQPPARWPRRLGRALAALVGTIVAIPVLVLLPLAKLETVLPPETGIMRASAAGMVIVLVALALVILANVAGSVVVLARNVRR